jgi:hypothetical protein
MTRPPALTVVSMLAAVSLQGQQGGEEPPVIRAKLRIERRES